MKVYAIIKTYITPNYHEDISLIGVFDTLEKASEAIMSQYGCHKNDDFSYSSSNGYISIKKIEVNRLYGRIEKDFYTG